MDFQSNSWVNVWVNPVNFTVHASGVQRLRVQLSGGCLQLRDHRVRAAAPGAPSALGRHLVRPPRHISDPDFHAPICDCVSRLECISATQDDFALVLPEFVSFVIFVYIFWRCLDEALCVG